MIFKVTPNTTTEEVWIGMCYIELDGKSYIKLKYENIGIFTFTECFKSKSLYRSLSLANHYQSIKI